MNISNLSKRPILIEAPTWKRFLAFIVDYFILNTLILFPFEGILTKLQPQITDFSTLFELAKNGAFNTINLFWVTLIMSIIAVIYFAVFESKYAQTPGKMLFKIFAVTTNSNKKELQTMTFWQGFRRALFICSIFVFPPLLIVDIAFIPFNPKKQRLFEKYTNSQTLQVDFI